MAEQEYPRKSLLTWEVDPDVTRLVMYTYVDGALIDEEELQPENGNREVMPRRDTTYELVSWCGSTMKDRRQLTIKVLPIPSTTPAPTNTPLPPVENLRLGLFTNSPINITVDMFGSIQRSFVYNETTNGTEKNVSIAKGNTIRLMATAKVSNATQTWNLLGWYNRDSGVQLSNTNTYEFSMLQNINLEARYTLEPVDPTTQRPADPPPPPPPPPPMDPSPPPPPVDESDTIRITLKVNRKVYTLGLPFNVTNYSTGEYQFTEDGTPAEIKVGANPDIWSGDQSQTYFASLDGETYTIPRNSPIILTAGREGFSKESNEYRLHTPLDKANDLAKTNTIFEADGWYTEDGFLIETSRGTYDPQAPTLGNITAGVDSALSDAGIKYLRFSQDITLVYRYTPKPIYRVTVRMSDALRNKLLGQSDRKFEFRMPTTFNVNGMFEYSAQMPRPNNWVIDNLVCHYSLNETGINNSGRYIDSGGSLHGQRASVFNGHLIGSTQQGNINNNNVFTFHIPKDVRLQIKWFGMNGQNAQQLNIGLRDVSTGQIIGLVGKTEFFNNETAFVTNANYIDYVDLGDRDQKLNDVDYTLQGISRGIRRNIDWEIVDLGDLVDLSVEVHDQNGTFKNTFKGVRFNGSFSQIKNAYQANQFPVKHTDRLTIRYKASSSVYNTINQAGFLYQVKYRGTTDAFTEIGTQINASNETLYEIHKYFSFPQQINADSGEFSNSIYSGKPLTAYISVNNTTGVVNGSATVEKPDSGGSGTFSDVITFGNMFIPLRYEASSTTSNPTQPPTLEPTTNPTLAPTNAPNITYSYELKLMQSAQTTVQLTQNLPVANSPQYIGIFELLRRGSDGTEIITDIPTGASISGTTVSGQPTGLNIAPTLLNGKLQVAVSGTPTQSGQFMVSVVVPTTSYGNVTVQGRSAMMTVVVTPASLPTQSPTDSPTTPSPQTTDYNIIPVTGNNQSFTFKVGVDIESSLQSPQYGLLGWDVFTVKDNNGFNTIAPSVIQVEIVPNNPLDSNLSYSAVATQQRVGFKVTGVPTYAAEHDVKIVARVGDKVAENRITVRVFP